MSTVAGGGGAAGDGENGISPQGNFMHMLDSEDGVSREELMAASLQNLQEARDEQTSSPRSGGGSGGGKHVDRTAWANDTWLKMYAIMDYVRTLLLHLQPARPVFLARAPTSDNRTAWRGAEPRPRTSHPRGDQGNPDGEARMEDVR